MKKIVSFVLSITFFITSCFFVNFNIFASDSNYSATYKTPETIKMEMTFDIYNIDVRNGTFTGHYSIFKDVLDIDKEISGTVQFYKDYYSCNFSFTYNWLFTSYKTSFYVDIYPLIGRALLTGGGGILIYTDVELFGTKNMYYNQAMSYSGNDMAMCMDISTAIYDKKEQTIQESIFDCYNKYNSGFNKDELLIYNENDSNPNNVEFAILNRKDETNKSIDIIVVIRGTLKDEWQGNVQITGKSYDENISVHENFDKAKDSLKEALIEYYNNYSSQFDEVNLIITGHSRGAAVSNLYAKEATDVMNSGTAKDIPVFDNVTAYTFACPNVEKYNNEMENYDNIFNYWFNTDIVPTVPLTNPTNGWNYWKYGRCYTMDVPKCFNKSFTINFEPSIQLSVELFLNQDIGDELDKAFSQWSTVDDYYNKQLYLLRTLNSISEQQTERIYTTLYEFLYNATFFNTVSNRAQGLRALRDLSICPQLVLLLALQYQI